jgi:signal transduction histidine kinase
VLGGVAGGLGRQLGIDPIIIRGAFIILGLVFATGVAIYALSWLLLPRDDGTPNILSKALSDRKGLTAALAFVPALVAIQVLSDALKAGWLSSIAWPILLSAASLILIWRNAPDDEKALLNHVAGPIFGLGFGGRPSRVGVIVRDLAGVACAIGGVVVLIERNPHGSVLRPLGGILLIVTGFILVFGPWWLRIAGDFVTERQAREFAEERADMAARLHDSVLQTLALIQRRADDPQTVRQLARAQERDLRAWLFDGRKPAGADDSDSTLAHAVQKVVAEVEKLHGVQVEAVTVGDCPLDEDLEALLAAAREAIVNAAKWSQAEVVSVFVEVEPQMVSLYVRDKGQGFDPGGVPGDRRGISDSIRGRMERHGGMGSVDSRPGEGTEVSLQLPRPKERNGRARQRGSQEAPAAP